VAEKITAEKVWQKNAAEKLQAEKCGRKITAEKSRQKNHGKKCKKITAAKPSQQNRTTTTTWLESIYERYGTSCLRYVL
jgi:hypothetical protein